MREQVTRVPRTGSSTSLPFVQARAIPTGSTTEEVSMLSLIAQSPELMRSVRGRLTALEQARTAGGTRGLEPGTTAEAVMEPSPSTDRVTQPPARPHVRTLTATLDNFARIVEAARTADAAAANAVAKLQREVASREQTIAKLRQPAAIDRHKSQLIVATTAAADARAARDAADHRIVEMRPDAALLASWARGGYARQSIGLADAITRSSAIVARWRPFFPLEVRGVRVRGRGARWGTKRCVIRLRIVSCAVLHMMVPHAPCSPSPAMQ